MKKCSNCDGKGYKTVKQNFGFGMMGNSRVSCDECNGMGEKPEQNCNKCHGDSMKEEIIEKKIKIPAGIQDGARLVIRQGGNYGGAGAQFGDLYIQIREKAHSIFIRDGLDVFCKVPLSFKVATLGGEIEVPTLRSKKKIKINPGTQSSSKMRIKDAGIKYEGYVGSQIIELVVEVPKNLTKEQKEKLEDFYNCLEGKEEKEDKSFFDKIKDVF